ncbi:hypothetical protein GQ44DRAFT_764407 [Phaeosphaeriaceae sp. PMI808]|nr:hypothetical protein GQ44DRAFT_764407 [Phaeosphaeriaceae sp. PMI808]
MSGNSLYDPDQDALNTRWVQPWSEAFRTQRDVGLRIPINFHTLPAVSLRQACFSNNQYEHNAFQKCFSNLLAVGFRRFEVDMYWDPLQSVWSLCPVEQPGSGNTEPQTVVSVSRGPTVIASTETVNAKIPETVAPLQGQSLGFDRRQNASPSPTSASSSTLLPSSPASSIASTSASARPTVISFPTPNGPPLLQIGRYNCTSQMRLELFTGILDDFLKATSTTTGADLLLLTLDVHAASSILNPNEPAPKLSPDKLPGSGSLLSDVMKGNLSAVTYTPTQLRDQRSNLNTSWYKVDWPNRPAGGYFDVSYNSAQNRYTQNGWPTEAFVEFKKFLRLGISYGSIDSQMQLYNTAPDSEFIFPPGTFTYLQSPTIASDGKLLAGCFFDAKDTTVARDRNSSWAITNAPSLNIDATSDLVAAIPSITNLTSCGITPLLNQSLGGATADKRPLPYAAFLRSTIWTWAPGEPLNATSPSDENRNRCAVMMISPYAGRWRVTDCRERHRVACHLPGQPYNWNISTEVSSYNEATSVCRSPYRFSVPHTALENAHLLAATRSNRENGDGPIFIDLNSINVPDCWVIGLNGTCPYANDKDDRIRIVVVPTVAAVIVFLFAALTFFVKCAANRRENKRGRRRKMLGGGSMRVCLVNRY